MTSDKKVFVSYSHADRAFAERFATALRAQGQDVWFDAWEIGPGDSIVTKIFEEGLRDAAAFAIVLSKESAQSRWVREELSVATIRRIEDLTRVIPILKEDVELPTALRALHWVDMRSDFDRGIRAILNVLHGVSEKPPLGELPPHLRAVVEPIGGLSRLATRVGAYLLAVTPLDEAFIRAVLNTDLAQALELTPTEVNDAVDELESSGLVTTNSELGTDPFSFRFVEATYLLYHTFEHSLPYKPAEDVRTAMAAIAALGSADGEELTKHTGLSHGRLNRAVDYIKDHGYADVQLALGTAPYAFSQTTANRQTRQMSQSI
jgi:DNA-binding MarR family transcriptional regulator